MEKRALKLFPTLVHSFKDVLSPEQLAIVYRHCMDAQAGEHGGFVGSAKSSFGDGKSAHLIDELSSRYAPLAGLQNDLATLIRDYGEELGFTKLTIDNSWFNVQFPGSLLRHHLHPEAKVSAALCVHSDDKSSKLCLENHNPFVDHMRPNKLTETTFEMVEFKLKPGDMVLFPAWIKHGSGFEANHSEARVVIGINAR